MDKQWPQSGDIGYYLDFDWMDCNVISNEPEQVFCIKERRTFMGGAEPYHTTFVTGSGRRINALAVCETRQQAIDRAVLMLNEKSEAIQAALEKIRAMSSDHDAPAASVDTG